jgi:hypothetical protein
MAEQKSSDGLKAWLEKQALPQPDGTYLIRPLFRPGVYQIDAATKRRWIRFRVTSWWLAVIVGVLILALKDDHSWISPRVTISAVLAFSALMVVEYGAMFWILRHAQRVPDELWKGPAVFGSWRLFPRHKYLWSAAFFGGLTAFTAWWIIGTAQVGSFWQNIFSLLLFAALLLLSVFNCWRAGRRQQ